MMREEENGERRKSVLSRRSGGVSLFALRWTKRDFPTFPFHCIYILTVKEEE